MMASIWSLRIRCFLLCNVKIFSLRLLPAFKRDNYAENDPQWLRICIYSNITLYTVLVFLNFHWMFLIF